MPKRGASRGDGSHSALIAVLLGACLIVVAILAEQAYDARRSHRAMAESVLRGYAALAADEMARRAATEVGFYTYYPAIIAVRDAVAASDGGALPAPADLASATADDAKRALTLVRTLYRFDAVSGRIETAGAALDSEAEAWLRQELAANVAKPLPPNRRYDVRYARLGGRLLAFVTAPLPQKAKNADVVLVGFELPGDALARLFRQARERGPLLPASLGGGDLAKGAIDLRVVDPFGIELVPFDGRFTPAYAALKKTGPGELNGILDGFELCTAIDPASASRLAIGGLPGSRLPFIAALIATTALLMLVAGLQLRREVLLGRMRADFVSRVSHELRTPLTQVRMFAETLRLDRVRSDGERQRYLAIIDREARRLSHLVENVLRFSRTERGEVRLAPRAQDIGPLVRDLLDEFRPVAEARHVRVTAQAGDGAMAVVDDDALRQVLLNLLDNAVKYGPEGQEVRVGVTNGSGSVRLHVDDEGPGIPAEDRERIFERFFRRAPHRESAVAGTGIGLTVVRDLVTLQSGQAWVEPGERGGARFVVEFPAATAGAS